MNWWTKSLLTFSSVSSSWHSVYPTILQSVIRTFLQTFSMVDLQLEVILKLQSSVMDLLYPTGPYWDIHTIIMGTVMAAGTVLMSLQTKNSSKEKCWDDDTLHVCLFVYSWWLMRKIQNISQYIPCMVQCHMRVNSGQILYKSEQVGSNHKRWEQVGTYGCW